MATTAGIGWTRERCEELDRSDPIGWARGRFALPGDVVYLEGNSLGAMPSAAPARLAEVLGKEWGEAASRSWGAGKWMEGPRRVGDKIARLIGAKPGEVVTCESTTIGLAKILGASLAAAPGKRRALLTTSTNFPSDLYAAQGMRRFFSSEPELRVVEPEALPAALGAGDVAAMFLTQVDFRTGALFDLGSLTDLAHRAGALAIWDLCHSAGAVPVGCEANGVDLAVGCGYKYLNGGPGSPAFVYVRSAHQGRLPNPLPGWMGHADPMAFGRDFVAAKDVSAFLTSTPSVLALAALETGLDAFEGVTIEQAREKSLQLTRVFMEVISRDTGGAVRFATPPEPSGRGSQVSIRHEDAAAIVREAERLGVLGDFRPPDICRFGFAPLYLRHSEVYEAARIVADILGDR